MSNSSITQEHRQKRTGSNKNAIVLCKLDSQGDITVISREQCQRHFGSQLSSKYTQTDSDLANEAKLCNDKVSFIIVVSLCMHMLSMRSTLLPTSTPRKGTRRYSGTRSNVKGAICIIILKGTSTTKLSFVAKYGFIR